MKKDIAIVTLSWIRTDEESKTVLETISNLSKIGIPLVIVDAGSPAKYQNSIREMSNVHFFESKLGLAEQLLISHKEGAELADYLFYLHTDKLDFSKNTVKEMIEKYMAFDKKGMFIPTRTKESIETYPLYQKTIEAFLNFFVSDYIGIENDYYAGPKIYPASLVKYLDQLEGQIGWGIEAYFYGIAKRLGMSFAFYPCYFQAPVDVENEEKTKMYRLKITEWQIKGLLQSQKVLL